MNKPDCYKCQHRGTVPGDCHSRCTYPGTSSDMFDMLMPENLVLKEKLNIKGDVHGIRSGWFMWPVNFDPVWLENCDGFEGKEDAKNKQEVEDE